VSARHRLVLVGLGLCVDLAVASCSSPSTPAPDGGAGRGGGFGGTGGTSGGAAPGHGGSSAIGVGGAGGAGDADLACLATKTLACPGVDRTKAFNSTLAASDAAAMCDCIATYAGGGSSPSCTCLDGSPGAVMAPASQAACLAQPYPPACTITVAQYIACTNLLWAKPCDAAAFVAAYQDPSCAPSRRRRVSEILRNACG